LYGGIFQWKNNGNEIFKIINDKEEKTDNIHGFNSKWSKFIHGGRVVLDD
jgi:hypothetical protein